MNGFTSLAIPGGGEITPQVEIFFPWKDGSTSKRASRMLRWLQFREKKYTTAWRVVFAPMGNPQVMSLFEVEGGAE